MSVDLEKIRREWLRQCAGCDGGILGGCTCPDEDVRPVLLALVTELEQTRARVARLEEALACPECGARGIAPCVVKGTTHVRSLHSARVFVR